jgi:dihydrofolate reductase
MAVVEVNISMSLDGYVAAPNPEQYPGLGEGGEILHDWLGEPGGKVILEQTFGDAGAVVTSRRAYDGTDGWGAEPPFRMPVFVLTHRAHEPVVSGATTFTFVTDGIASAVSQASAAAGDQMVHVMGWASLIQEALDAGLVGQVCLHVTPVIYGAGTSLFDDIKVPIRLERLASVETDLAHHLTDRVVK